MGDFGNRLADLSVGKQLQHLRHQKSKLVEIETEADYFGGIAGHIAGYNSLKAAPEALRDGTELSTHLEAQVSHVL